MLKYLYIIYMSFFGDTDNYKNVMDQLDELNNRITTNNKNSTDDKNKILKLLQDINLNKITKFLSDSCEKLKTTKDELSEETQKIDTSNDVLTNQIDELKNNINELNQKLEEKEKIINKLNNDLTQSKNVSQDLMKNILEKIKTIPQDKIELTELLEEAERIKKEIDNVKDCNGKDFQEEPEAKPEEIDQTGTTEKTTSNNNNFMNVPKGFFSVNPNILKRNRGGKKRKTRFALQSKKRNNNKMKISKKNKQDNSESETRNITSSIANIAGSKDTNPQYTSSSLAGSIKKRGRKSKKINKTKKSRKSKKSKKTKKSRKSKKSKKSKK